MNHILKAICLIGAVFMASCSQGQFDWNKAQKEAKTLIKDQTGQNSLSESEVIAGLKEALETGTKNATDITSKLHGFYHNPEIKIPFPKEAEKVKNTAMNMGMDSQVEKFEYNLNRAAEEAAKEAAPVFISAIKGMTVTDGWAILKGADDEATQYLQKTTTADLKARFRPVVQEAIDKVELTKYWNPIISKYNMIPGVQKMNPDLTAYVTEEAINGLFVMIAKEELKIRKDPAARVTDLLEKVFSQQ